MISNINRFSFWIERLYGFHNRVIAGLPSKIVFSGDSTTFGSGGASGVDLDQIFKKTVLSRHLPDISTVNLGKPGEHTGEFESNHIQEIVASAPNLIVLRWGANDIYYGRTIEQFAESLSNAVESLRNEFPLDGGVGIVIMSPNSMSDHANGRDSVWIEAVSSVCKSVADYNKCAFIDTFAAIRDSENAAGLWMDDPYSDGRAVHPLLSMNMLISSLLFDALYPSTLCAISPKRVQVCELMMVNGWKRFADSTSDPAYFLDNGLVRLQGLVSSGVAANLTVIATLPEGARPPKNVYFNVLTASSTPPTTPSPSGIVITRLGEIKTFANCQSGYLSLDGICFVAQP